MRRSAVAVFVMLGAGCASHMIVPSPAPPGAVVSTPRDGVRVMESPDGVLDGAFDRAVYALLRGEAPLAHLLVRDLRLQLSS